MQQTHPHLVLKMGTFKLILTVVCSTALVMGNKVDYSKLEDMIVALRSDIVKLKEDAKSKETEIMELKTELMSSDSLIAFDCYLTEDWNINGIIQFNGCSVDTTIEDPWKGSFSVPSEGLWQFTMTAGEVYFPDSGTGNIYLKVDGIIVATSYTNPTDGSGMVKKDGKRFSSCILLQVQISKLSERNC